MFYFILRVVDPTFSIKSGNLFSRKIQRSRTTNGEIDPTADQIYEIWNCTIFVL